MKIIRSAWKSVFI